MWIPSDALLAEYLAGHCSDAEARAIERWLTEDQTNSLRLEELRLIWRQPWPPAPADVDAMWAEVRKTVGAERARPARPVRVFHVERPTRWHLPVAAAAAALLLAGVSPRVIRVIRDATSSAGMMHVYATPRGQRATVQLSDGTRLTLAPASRLRLPAHYGQGTREVYLDGEAVFDVVHDTTRPFRVYAKDAVAEDLGTRFDVRAYAEDAAVTVAVAEGVVALGRVDASPAGGRRAGDVAQGVVLRRGDVGALGSGGQVTTASGAIVDMYFAWTDGRLRFVETPLPEVLRAVDRWYGVEVRIDGPALAARTVTAEFAAQSPSDLMRALAFALRADVTWSGKVATLHAKS